MKVLVTNPPWRFGVSMSYFHTEDDKSMYKVIDRRLFRYPATFYSWNVPNLTT